MADTISQLLVDLKNLQGQPVNYMRPVVIGLLGEVRKRIHVEGRKADGSPIGTYSNAYLNLRSGNYTNSDKVTKGAKKGSNKNAGTFTGKSKKNSGKPRPNYHRGSEPKVILSLTRQMEQDFSAIAEEDLYGLGFNNPDNFDKATWNDQRYKRVYDLSPEELEMAEQTITDYINGLFG